MPKLLIAAALLAAGSLWPDGASARAVVGKPAPWFKLKSFTGETVTNKDLRGRPAVLVVGMTRRSAPLCKQWILALHRRHRARIHLYQVIVAMNPWYIPRSLVRKKIAGFVPGAHHHRVLVEWYRVFADAYGVPKQDWPVVFLIDAGGIVRHRHRGKVSRAQLARIASLVTASDTSTASKSK